MAVPPRRVRIRAGYVILTLTVGLPLMCAVGIAGYFRLSSPTQALRSSVMESVPGEWDKRFAIHVGGFTLGLVRLGSGLFHLRPEPQAALASLHSAEVGIYRLHDGTSESHYPAIFAAADKSMKRRGWERIVGVAENRQFVAVYVPRGMHSVTHVAACVVVLHERDLVVASARGNPVPLIDLAQRLPGRPFKVADIAL